MCYITVKGSLLRGDAARATVAHASHPTMSPTKRRVKNIKVHVPRHNSQRIGPALTAQIETVAKEKRLRTDVRQPTNEVSSAIAIAIVRPLPMLPVPSRIDLNTRKVLPSGTRCYLLPALSGVHSGISVHSSRSFSQKTVITCYELGPLLQIPS